MTRIRQWNPHKLTPNEKFIEKMKSIRDAFKAPQLPHFVNKPLALKEPDNG